MGQIYRDPLPEVLNPGIFAKTNTRSFDTDASDVGTATRDVIFNHFDEDTRLGRPTVLNAVVLTSRLYYGSAFGAAAAAAVQGEQVEPVVELTVRIPGLEVNPAPCTIPVEPGIWCSALAPTKAADENVGTREPLVTEDTWAIINLHEKAETRDPLLASQPLPVPGSTVQVEITEMTRAASGVHKLNYVGPSLGLGVPFPEVKDPPPNPGDCPPLPINPFEDPPVSGSENPCIKIPTVPKPTGKIATARTPGPPPVPSKVWGGYGSDSGIVTGTKVTANPKGGTVGFQAKRNRAAGGAKYPYPPERGDNHAYARMTGRIGKQLIKYVADGGSGKADPNNKPIGGTMSFARVRELVQLPTVTGLNLGQQSGLNPLEKYLICLMAGCEDQSDRPYNLYRTGYKPPGSGLHCAAYVNNARHIAYTLFYAEGKNHDITQMNFEDYSKIQAMRSSLIFDKRNATEYDKYLNIANRNATPMSDPDERKRLKVIKPKANSSPTAIQKAWQYGVHEGSLIGGFTWKPEGKFTLWNGQAPIMPGDLIHPRARLKIQALLIGASAFVVQPGQQLCVQNPQKCPKGVLPFWAKRPSMIGHITLTFCAPNGVLMNSESGGAYTGTGAMPLEDYLIRNTHAKSAGDWFPSDFLILETPEMTKIWEAMGGRPNRPWTPDLFRDLCPNLVQLPEFAQYLS